VTAGQVVVAVAARQVAQTRVSANSRTKMQTALYLLVCGCCCVLLPSGLAKAWNRRQTVKALQGLGFHRFAVLAFTTTVVAELGVVGLLIAGYPAQSAISGGLLLLAFGGYSVLRRQGTTWQRHMPEPSARASLPCACLGGVGGLELLSLVG
jgi:hypothetical protein